MEGFLDKYYFGRNPTELILANYKNLHRKETDYFGGYTTFMGAYRDRGPDSDDGIGATLKASMTYPGKPPGIYLIANLADINISMHRCNLLPGEPV